MKRRFNYSGLTKEQKNEIRPKAESARRRLLYWTNKRQGNNNPTGEELKIIFENERTAYLELQDLNDKIFWYWMKNHRERTEEIINAIDERREKFKQIYEVKE